MNGMLNRIYNKVQINGTVTPMEVVLVVRDLHRRMLEMEEYLNGLERPTTSRSTSSKVSKKKVSGNRVQKDSDK
jgi:hypothetical protein